MARSLSACAATAAFLALTGGCGALDARYRDPTAGESQPSRGIFADAPTAGEGHRPTPAGYTRLKILVPVRTGQPALVPGWQDAFGDAGVGAEARIEGLDEWRESGYWSLQDGEVRFRARRPGPQEPRFAVHVGERTECFLFHCNVRLSALAVDFRWNELHRTRGEMRVPFEVTVPEGFAPPFAVEAEPRKALVITQPSRWNPRSWRVRGYLVCEELRPGNTHLAFRLVDTTGAEATTTMDIPEECECIAPPRRIRDIVKRFKNSGELLAESARILGAADKAAILAGEDGRNFVILCEWLGAQEKCPTLSDRVRRLFRDQATLYREILSGETESPGRAADLLKRLQQLSSGDIETEFLEGYYGK